MNTKASSLLLLFLLSRSQQLLRIRYRIWCSTNMNVHFMIYTKGCQKQSERQCMHFNLHVMRVVLLENVKKWYFLPLLGTQSLQTWQRVGQMEKINRNIAANIKMRLLSGIDHFFLLGTILSVSSSFCLRFLHGLNDIAFIYDLWSRDILSNGPFESRFILISFNAVAFFSHTFRFVY